MAKKTEWEERIIPKKDKELRSLYMPESYTKNLKGKGKKMKLRGSGRKKSTSVRNLVTGGRNRTSGRTGRTRRG